MFRDLQEENVRLTFKLKEVEGSEGAKEREFERLLTELKELNAELNYKMQAKEKRLSGMLAHCWRMPLPTCNHPASLR